MERVAIVGPGGAGKSTLARALGERTGLPVIHLDREFWKPGWVEPTRDEWRTHQQRLLAAPRWIMDGNDGGTFDLRFALADTILIVAPPRRVFLGGAVRRMIAGHRQAVQAPGCPERVDPAFLRYLWRWPTDARTRLDIALAAVTSEVAVIELNSRDAVAGYLAGLSC